MAFSLYLTVERRSTPSFSTAMLWVKKLGYSQLHVPKEKANDWVTVVDESIGIGQEKVLVVLGIRRSKIDFTRPLKLGDMVPVLVKSRESWKGNDVAHELEGVKKQLGTVIYAVTDAGSTLKCGLKKADIPHVYDITHAIAIALEKLYKKDVYFKEYTAEAGQMRYKLCCSKNAHLIPPNQRSKSRFLNIDILSKWGIKVLRALGRNEITAEERDQLQWVQEKGAFIVEMDILISVVEEISILLKNNGLNRATKTKCISILRKCKSGKLKLFRQFILDYLEENMKVKSKRSETILCCSDIIETTFGKYKNELGKNPMSGITDLVLIIPAFTSTLSADGVNAAIDSCSVKDIEEWKRNNLCNSLLSKRKAVYHD